MVEVHVKCAVLLCVCVREGGAVGGAVRTCVQVLMGVNL